ncbi:Mating-type switching protein swi10 [Nosema granulosis]|uniref:Mating-type switching protein swi10 n=1 Tax=Nosema granulosis TaxID=83296 RepID=A0A9P6H1P7_9MICR|nr:Mating-type switching protein swi10 [Nosema granulosis]
MIKINSLQKGNNLISHLSFSTFVYEDKLSTDYEINGSISVLFLSLRFHCCKPEYIYKRINKLKPYKVSILLLLVDSDNYSSTLLELHERVRITIIVAFSNEECARYLRGFDINANRSINLIRKKDSDHETFLTSFKKLNKNDVEGILNNYTSLKEAFEDVDKNMKFIGGVGEIKSSVLKKYYEMDFKASSEKDNSENL